MNFKINLAPQPPLQKSDEAYSFKNPSRSPLVLNASIRDQSRNCLVDAGSRGKPPPQMEKNHRENH